MNKHTTAIGEIIEYPEPSPAVADYLARAVKAANDPSVTLNDLIEFIYSVNNPLLDTTMLPGRGMVTRAIFADQVYHVFADLLDVKRVQLGTLDPKEEIAAYTATVAEAAEQLGISETAVKKACQEHRLAAIRNGGQWLIDPHTIASYRVSNRGPKGKGDRQRKAVNESPVIAQLGGAKGGSIAVKVANGELVRLATKGKEFGFPVNWSQAVVRLTTKEGVRVFLIEESESEATIEHVGLTIHGRFKIVKKINNTKAANVFWAEFGLQAA